MDVNTNNNFFDKIIDKITHQTLSEYGVYNRLEIPDYRIARQYPLQEDFVFTQEGCSSNVPRILAEEIIKPRNTRTVATGLSMLLPPIEGAPSTDKEPDIEALLKKKRGAPSAQHVELQKLEATLVSRNLTDEELKEGLKILCNHHTYSILKSQDGVYKYSEGRKKGFYRYSKEVKEKIIKGCKYITRENRQVLFVTTTCNPTAVGFDRWYAWKNYPVFLNQLWGKYIKHKGLEVVWKKESHLNGFPHVHAVLSFPAGTIKGFEKWKSGVELYNGLIRKMFPATEGFMRPSVKKLTGNKVPYYLVKYLTKGTSVTLAKLANKKGKFTKDERKMIQEVLYSTMTGSRLYAVPRNLEEKMKLLEKKEVEEKVIVKDSVKEISVEEAYKNYIEGGKVGGVAPLLINNSTNFPCLNRMGAAQAPFIKGLQTFQSLKKTLKEVPQKNLKAMYAEYPRVTCGGCLKSHVARFLQGHYNDPVVNISIRTTKGRKTKTFTREILKNNDVWVHRLFSVIELYTRFIAETKGTMEEWKDDNKREAWLNARAKTAQRRFIKNVGAYNKRENSFKQWRYLDMLAGIAE